MLRWQSDDGLKFNDFDSVTVSLLERARIDGQHQVRVAGKNWSFDLVAMTQTNMAVRLCYDLFQILSDCIVLRLRQSEPFNEFLSTIL
jgi:hypothetical protein